MWQFRKTTKFESLTLEHSQHWGFGVLGGGRYWSRWHTCMPPKILRGLVLVDCVFVSGADCVFLWTSENGRERWVEDVASMDVPQVLWGESVPVRSYLITINTMRNECGEYVLSWSWNAYFFLMDCPDPSIKSPRKHSCEWCSRPPRRRWIAWCDFL